MKTGHRVASRLRPFSRWSLARRFHLVRPVAGPSASPSTSTPPTAPTGAKTSPTRPSNFRAHYGNPAISKWDIFHYIYAVLHHPAYREKFADNLKRELPRIPLPPDFPAFAAAGENWPAPRRYEKLEPWPLEWVENPAYR